MHKWIAFASIMFAVAACKRSSDAPPAPGAAAPETKQADTPSKSDEDLAEKMRHCPVTLPGVQTELQDTDDGIRFVLHATAPEVITEARRRAHALAEFTAGRSNAKHGGGKRGGFMRSTPHPGSLTSDRCSMPARSPSP